MAFKTMSEYNKERGYDNWFMLRNDGDSADVIFLYRGPEDVLVADAHYIKSSSYTGYVHCCGRGCPACGKGISVRNKLFIPLYNLNSGKIEFWDRNMFFENQLNQDVFTRYPNPSEFVFRITRHGVARDVNTTYAITAVSKNDVLPYDAILSKFHTKFPDVYSTIIKEYSSGELYSMLNSSETSTSDSGSYNDLPSYQVTPRASYSPSVNPVDTIDESDTDVPFDEDIDLGDEPVF